MGPDMGQDSPPRGGIPCSMYICSSQSPLFALHSRALRISRCIVAKIEPEAFVNHYEVDHYRYFRFRRIPKRLPSRWSTRLECTTGTSRSLQHHAWCSTVTMRPSSTRCKTRSTGSPTTTTPDPTSSAPSTHHILLVLL
jgi:hypothetical protein